MHRITISFSKNDFIQLQNSAIQKGVSLAQYIRDLVNIGRRVEEATKQPVASNEVKNEAVLNLGDTKELWKNNLLCALESRYLIRYLVDNLPNQSDEKREAVINAVKEKAQALVAELIED